MLGTKVFIWGAGGLLLVTAIAKMISAYRPAPHMYLRDPLFEFLTNRQVLAGAAVVELIIVILLLWVRSPRKKLALIAWLASTFFLYRIFVGWVREPGFVLCPCLGNAAAWLRLSPAQLDWVTKGILVYLLLGSYSLLALHWRQMPAGSR